MGHCDCLLATSIVRHVSCCCRLHDSQPGVIHQQSSRDSRADTTIAATHFSKHQGSPSRHNFMLMKHCTIFTSLPFYYCTAKHGTSSCPSASTSFILVASAFSSLRESGPSLGGCSDSFHVAAKLHLRSSISPPPSYLLPGNLKHQLFQPGSFFGGDSVTGIANRKTGKKRKRSGCVSH